MKDKQFSLSLVYGKTLLLFLICNKKLFTGYYLNYLKLSNLSVFKNKIKIVELI